MKGLLGKQHFFRQRKNNVKELYACAPIHFFNCFDDEREISV